MEQVNSLAKEFATAPCYGLITTMINLINKNKQFKILGSRRGITEDSGIPGSDAVSLAE